MSIQLTSTESKARRSLSSRIWKSTKELSSNHGILSSLVEYGMADKIHRDGEYVYRRRKIND